MTQIKQLQINKLLFFYFVFLLSGANLDDKAPKTSDCRPTACSASTLNATVAPLTNWWGVEGFTGRIQTKLFQE